MGVPQCRGDVRVAEQLLNGADVAARFEEVCGEGVTQAVAGRRFGDSGRTHGDRERALDGRLLDVAAQQGAGGAVVVAAAGGGGGGGAAPAAAEKATADVVLAKVADATKKIAVIKVVREITGLGLKEAKDMVDGAPKVVKNGVPREEASQMKEKLEKEGATVELK